MIARGALIGLALLGLVSPARADAVEDFYRGRSINLIISTGAGEGQDKTARLIARHWSNHIPGKPSFVPRNMPGAGNLRATDFLYNQAPADGATIAAIIPSFVLQQLLGTAEVRYDAARLQWLGSSASSNPVVYVWHTAGVKSLAEATQREITMGGTGAGSNSVIYPTILNNLIGTRFKVIMGYNHSGEVNLAMERGEVQGRASETFNTLMANSPDWVKDKKIDILVQIGREKERGFEHVPLITEFARDQGSRDVLALFGDVIALGRPYLAPPGVPAERVAALRASFDATMADPALLADARKARLEIAPTRGAVLQSVAEKMIGSNAEMIARVRAALESRDGMLGERAGAK